MRRAGVTGLAVGLLVSGCTGGGSTSSTTSERSSSGTSGTSAPRALALASAEIKGAAPGGSVPAGTAYAVTVTLTKGVSWSDGTPLTSKDFLGEYNLLWAQGDPVWQSLTDVQAPDDTTLVFDLKEVSPGTLRSLLRSNQTGSRSQFAAVFDEAAALRAAGTQPTDPKVAALVKKVQALAPTKTVSYGPYSIDETSVTAQQLTLKKNPGGLNASKIDFDKVLVYWGSTAQSVPLLLSDQLDYSTDAFTASDVTLLERRKNLTLLRNPLGTGTALWFNETARPAFAKAQFRQAVAYVLDRTQNAKVALGEAGKPVEKMAGFSDTLVPGWLDSATAGSLNGYQKDPAKAEQLLDGIGFTKSGKGWTDETGKPVKFEITAPTDFPDFLASAKNVSQQLNDFGFSTTVRGIPAASRPDTIKQGRYEAMLDFGLVSTPSHPHTSLDFTMAAGFFGTNNPEATGKESKGLDFPWKQKAPDGSEVYIPDLLKASIAGNDLNAQKKAVATLSQVFNSQLPVIPLFERYTTDPIADGPRVTGWLDPADPVYKNNQGSDNYVAIQFLNGILRKAKGGDGTFRTNLPYLQPPDASYSFYSPNSLVQSFNSPSYHIVFPPLFWYSEKDQAYVPSLAQTYSIVKTG